MELTLSRSGRVLALEGCNPDGDTLADGYDFAGKQAETVTVELVDRAMAMGFLSDGDAVALTVESGDGDWTAGEEAALTRGLEEAYGESIVVCLVICRNPRRSPPRPQRLRRPLRPRRRPHHTGPDTCAHAAARPAGR